MKKCFLPFLLATASVLVDLPAADITKLNNTTVLNDGGSWAGGSVPGSGDIALWENTVTTGGRINALGGNVSFGGVRIGTWGNGDDLVRIDNTAGAVMTLGASGIDLSAANANLQISASVDIAASQVWTVAAGRLLTVSGTITGAQSLSLAGSGTFALTGNTNSYSGGTTIGDGAFVQINSSGGLTQTPFGTGTVTIGDGVTIAGLSAGNRTIANNVVLNGDVTFGNPALASSNFQLGGSIDVGNATRTISIVNAAAPTPSASGLAISPVTGGVIGSGRLVLANGNAGDSPAVWVRWGGSGTFASTADLTIGENVTVFFAATGMFSSSVDLTIEGGGILDLSSKGGSSYDQTVGSLTGSGTVTNFRNVTGVSTLTIAGTSGTSTFAGTIASGTATGASVAITKAGDSTQIFTGSNSYIGQTQVTAGTLLVNGYHIESAAVAGNGYNSSTNGHFLVGSGATFGGGGLIAGNNAQNNSNMILVQSGGFLTAGAAGEALRLDGQNLSGVNARVLNLASGAEVNFNLAGDGSAASQIEMWNYAGGDLLLNSNEINLTLTGPVVAGTYTVTLFEFYSDSGTTLTNSGITSGLVLGAIDPNITGTPTIIYDAAGGTISLQYTVVPEPSVSLLAGLGIVLALRRRRSQRMRA